MTPEEIQALATAAAKAWWDEKDRRDEKKRAFEREAWEAWKLHTEASAERDQVNEKAGAGMEEDERGLREFRAAEKVRQSMWFLVRWWNEWRWR